MPTPRSEVAVAPLDGKIYVIGGFEADGSPSARVEVYDPATNKWSEAAPPAGAAPPHGGCCDGRPLRDWRLRHQLSGCQGGRFSVYAIKKSMDAG